MNTRITCIAACFAFISSLHAQDNSSLNQPLAPVFINPSFAGSNGLFRSQVLANDYGLSVSADGYNKRLRTGAGLAFGLANGLSNSTDLAFSCAHHIPLLQGKLKLIPSVQLGYSQRKYETWNPGTRNFYWQSINYLSVSGGFLVNYKRFYAGIGAYHLNTPDISSSSSPYTLPIRYSAYMSYNFIFEGKHLLNVYVKSDFQAYRTTTRFGINGVLGRHLVIGAGTTATFFDNYYFNASLGYKHNFFSVIATYDQYWSLFNNYNSLNLVLSYTLRNKEQRRTLTNMEAW